MPKTLQEMKWMVEDVQYEGGLSIYDAKINSLCAEITKLRAQVADARCHRSVFMSVFGLCLT